jgi:hypothetical protein
MEMGHTCGYQPSLSAIGFVAIMSDIQSVYIMSFSFGCEVAEVEQAPLRNSVVASPLRLSVCRFLGVRRMLDAAVMTQPQYPRHLIYSQ